jgi:hypothetical protein
MEVGGVEKDCESAKTLIARPGKRRDKTINDMVMKKTNINEGDTSMNIRY